MEKIKAFFQNKIVKIGAWVLMALCAVALIIGGATVETLSGGIALVAGIVSAISALVAFICNQIKKE